MALLTTWTVTSAKIYQFPTVQLRQTSSINISMCSLAAKTGFLLVLESVPAGDSKETRPQGYSSHADVNQHFHSVQVQCGQRACRNNSQRERNVQYEAVLSRDRWSAVVIPTSSRLLICRSQAPWRTQCPLVRAVLIAQPLCIQQKAVELNGFWYRVGGSILSRFVTTLSVLGQGTEPFS